MARQPLTINGKDFGSKKDAKEHFRKMLARHQDNAPIEGEDAEDLLAALERHPEATQKVGCGVAGFYAAWSSEGTRCFHLRRHDGTVTDFSFHSCVDARAPTPHQEFMEAAREAVSQKMLEAKRRHYQANKGPDGTVRCDLTGQPLRLEEAHLDHAEPLTFEVLVRTFIAAQNITNPADHITPSTDMQYVARFRDEALAQAFRDFHERAANIRWVSSRANLSLGPKHHIRHRRGTVKL